MLWEVDIYPAPGEPDRLGAAAASAARELGLADRLEVVAAHGFLIEGPLDAQQADHIARSLLVDSVVELLRGRGG